MYPDVIAALVLFASAVVVPVWVIARDKKDYSTHE